MADKLRTYLLAPAYYLVSFALAVIIVSSANDASRAYESVSAHQTASARADRALRETLESLTLGLYGGGSEKSEELADAVELARYFEARATGAGWLLVGLSVAFILATHLSESRTRPASGAALARHLFGVSAVFLIVGLLAPVLTVVVQEEVVLLGRVVLQYESKGIVTTIHKLYHVGNVFIAVLLLLFSVILPVLKIVLSLIALYVDHARTQRVTVAVTKFIGRWSMTDVFVVAVLLAFLTADTAQLTDATLGPGLYFFAGYGLLSIAAGHLMIRREERLEKAAGSGPL